MPDPINDVDGYLAYLVLAGVLSDGDGSRLQQRMVHQDAVVVDIGAGAGLFGPFEARDPDTFTITLIHPHEVPRERVLAALDDELEKLAETPPDEQELRKVTARWTASTTGWCRARSRSAPSSCSTATRRWCTGWRIGC